MKKYIAVVLAFVMVFALCACGSSSTAATTETAATEAPATTTTTEVQTVEAVAAEEGFPDLGDFEFTLSMHDPVTSSNGIFMQSWADAVNAATDGHVTITIYGSATLSAATDIADNVTAGAVDIGWLYTSYYAGQFPLSDVINVPFQASAILLFPPMFSGTSMMSTPRFRTSGLIISFSSSMVTPA